MEVITPRGVFPLGERTVTALIKRLQSIRLIPKNRLGRELIVLVTMKLILLSGLYLAFFGPPHRLHLGGAEVAARLLSTTPPGSPR